LTHDTGRQQRLEILRRNAERAILDPLRTHGWTAAIEESVEAGEYLLISAERGGHPLRRACYRARTAMIFGHLSLFLVQIAPCPNVVAIAAGHNLGPRNKHN